MITIIQLLVSALILLSFVLIIGVPVILGANGIERILELELSEGELESLQGSGNFYKSQLKELLGY